MKKVFKILGILLIVCYMGVALFLTVCLLNYNDYNITELGNKSLVIIRDDELEPDFKKSDLVVVTKNQNNEIKRGDMVFFYNTYQNQISVNFGKVQKTQYVNEEETTYFMDGDLGISSEYMLGKAETAKVYSGLGNLLSVLESKWGFLFVIILPILVLFIYQIYAVIIEMKRPLDE